MIRLPQPRQRADGRWEAQIELSPLNGKRRRQSVYGHTSEECTSNLVKALADRENGENPIDKRTKLGPYLDYWLGALIDLRPHTLRFYGDQVRLHIKPALGDRTLANLTRADVQGLVNAKMGEGLSPRMVRHIRSTLRAALNHAEEEGILRRGTNPAARKIRLPSIDAGASRPNAMTPAQVRHVLSVSAATEGHKRHHALWAVCATVGLRQAEALGLQWSDLQGASLAVSGQLQRQDGRLQRVPYTKTDSGMRTIALPAVVLAALQAHRERQDADRAKESVWSMEGYIFATRRGGPLEPRNVIRAWHALLTKAGLPRFRFHDLRHTAATNMIRAGIDIKTVSAILGHKDAATTLRIYQHVQTDHLEDAAKKMEAMLG